MRGRLQLVLVFVLAAVVSAAVAIPAAAADRANSAQTAGDLAVVAGTMRAVQTGQSATATPLGAQGVAVDSSGNVYVADSLNNDIEKITPGGTLSIIAGNGSKGKPTPGSATSSSLNEPTGVAVDSSGDVYIADSGNDEVEKVTSGGTLSIITGTGTAGSPTSGAAAAGSSLNEPSGVAVDSSGDVYIADTGNNEIDEVSGGILTVIAGNGERGNPTTGTATESSLSSPNGVAVDSSGDVYIADSSNSVVEEVSGGRSSIDAGLGQLTVIAGDLSASYNGPPTSGSLATSDALDYPTGVAVDGAGDVYVAEKYGRQVMEVSGGQSTILAGNGTLSIVAGTGDFGTPTVGVATGSDLDDASGVAVSSSGAVYIADTNNDMVEKVSAGKLSIFAGVKSEGAPTSGAATSSKLYDPSSVAVDASGNFYIADTYNQEVEKVTAGGQLSIIAGTGTAGTPTVGTAAGTAATSELAYPTAVAVDSSGDVYIANGGGFGQGSYVLKVTPSGALSVIAGNGSDGTPTAGTATSSKLGQLSGLAVDSSGNVYIAERSPSEVLKVTPGGTLSIIAGTTTAGSPTPGPATSSDLNDPIGLAVDSSGNVYIADRENGVVEEVNHATGDLSIIAGTGNNDNDDVRAAVTPAAGNATTTTLGEPYGVALDASGNVYIADAGNAVIDKVTPSGTLSVFAGNGKFGPPTPGPATSSALGYPTAVAVGSSGNLYIADDDNNDVEEVYGAGTTPTPSAPVAQVSSVRVSAATTSVTIKCIGQSTQKCATKVTLTTSYKVRVGRRTVTKTVTIATATATVVGGKTGTVKVVLNHSGVVLLKKDKKLTAKLVVTQGTKVVKTQVVKLTAPKRR